MPIYEYECEKCHTTFEIIQPISAKPLKKHDENGCNGKVQRLVSASGFILKGSGWYVNDYPSDSRKEGWDKESQAKPGAEAPAEKAESAPQKPETKPAAPAKPAKPAKPTAKKSTAKSPYAGRKPKKAKTPK